MEYLCQWRGLSYAETTWEDYDQIKEAARDPIEAFLTRLASPYVPSKSASFSKQRPVFEKMLEQPDYIAGGTLKEFQITGLNWLAYLWSRNENGILADEVCPNCAMIFFFGSIHVDRGSLVDGTGEDGADMRIFVVAVPRASAVRAVFDRRASIYFTRLAYIVGTVGSRPKRRRILS